MATILVTGGAGYIGSVCCSQLLERGHRVTVVDDLSTGHAKAVPEGAKLHQLDIQDRIALAVVLAADRFDAVFHFAAKALIPESVTNPGMFFDSNVASGIAFLETIRAAGIRKFVFSSSAAVYGNPHAAPINEEHPKSPVNAYGESKLVFERILQWYAKCYGWTVVAFRYFNACGATECTGEDHHPETHIIPLLLQTAAGERDLFEIYGNDYPTPDGTCVRDYVHVKDIAQAHLLALEIHDQAKLLAYNIGTGISYSVRQVCEMLEREIGQKLNVKYGARRQGDPAILCASPSRLMRELGWKPRFSGLPTIIRSAWEWRRDHPNGYSGIDGKALPPSTATVLHESTDAVP
ncbi:MAG TPA: UDP-glucose 4-epimerase GalE [Terriglobales bacterium]|nr:UDP-glucose 4-epimerase GalE [Terriglobales bacterium]HXY49000.1 UDP-glucose 4-epimerase GalE [Terriglobales bacterium]